MKSQRMFLPFAAALALAPPSWVTVLVALLALALAKALARYVTREGVLDLPFRRRTGIVVPGGARCGLGSSAGATGR